jgi:cholesterol transport system auxiliary component
MMPDAKLARRSFLVSAGAVLLSACGSVLPAPVQPQLYVFNPGAMAPAGANVRWRLAVATPECLAALDTQRIALIRSATTMDYYANAAWPDRAPLLIQRELIRTFENSGRILGIGRDTSGLPSDYVLATELRDFEARYETGTPQVQVTIVAKMVKLPERNILAVFTANQRADADANTVDAVVMAFDQASAAAIGQIAGWALAVPPPTPA